jgi:hypothetical protein
VSFTAMEWALEDSPVADTTERLILVGMAGKADNDGCNAFRSRKTLARLALCDVKTVQRKLNAMVTRGVIALGDQSAARRIPEHVRPKVYDLLIPYAWFGPERLKTVNREREDRGLPPITSKNRPPIAPAPAKTRRSDLGKKRPKPHEDDQVPGDDGGTLNPPEPGDSQSREGGLSIPKGGTLSPGRGDSQSREGGLTDPQLCPVTPSSNSVLETPLPSVRCEASESAREAAATEGRTDGEAAPQEQTTTGWGVAAATPPAHPVEVTPGVALLLTIGRELPAFLLTGKTLADQGAMVTGLLKAGWTNRQLREVITRPLPPDTRSLGAVISRRLSDAAASTPLGAVDVELPRQPRPQHPFCADCGARRVEADGDLCPRCTGTECATVTCYREADPGNPDGLCQPCAEQLETNERSQRRRAMAPQPA